MKNFLIALCLISLTGCSSIPNILKVDTAPVVKEPLTLPKVDVINARDVKYIIVTPENAEQVFKDLENNKTDVVLFALTDDGYKNLSLNIAELMKLVKQQQAIIAAYKKYYETDN